MTIIRLDDQAQQYLTKQLKTQPESIGVYIALEKAGCAGYMYQIRTVAQTPKDTREFSISGIRVFIPPASITRLQGSTLSYKKQGIDFKAVFDNPNVTLACGCGDSVELINQASDKHVSS